MFFKYKCFREWRSSRFNAPLLFGVSVFLLTVASLWPIWSVRLLPMQDYPQHLFLANVITTFEDASFNWKQYYSVDIGLRPYMLWYVVMNCLAVMVDIETAGKIIFSLYILLITALVAVSRRLSPTGSHPWGALLLFPFAFNQIYFMGFSNYLISLPILFLALLDLKDLSVEPLSMRSMTRHGLYLTILLLNHPYTCLVYMGLAAATSASFFGRWKTAARALVPALLLGVVFTLWYMTQHGPSTAPSASAWKMHWLPLRYTIFHYLLMFAGLHFTAFGLLQTVLWLVIFTIFSSARGGNIQSKSDLSWPSSVFLGSLLGFLVLPFWFGYYSYFNLRLAPVSYFALSLLLSHLRVSSRSGLLIAGCSLILLFSSIRTQAMVSCETEEILPLLAKTEKNALVLPLMFDSSSAALDPTFFYEIHAHDASYYHVVVGGGANPNLFPNAMMPVQYIQGLHLPLQNKPDAFSWSHHGRFYDYVITRAAPQSFDRRIRGECDVVATSGQWKLFRNKRGRNRI